LVDKPSVHANLSRAADGGILARSCANGLDER